MKRLQILPTAAFVLPLLMTYGMNTQYEKAACSMMSGRNALRRLD